MCAERREINSYVCSIASRSDLQNKTEWADERRNRFRIGDNYSYRAVQTGGTRSPAVPTVLLRHVSEISHWLSPFLIRLLNLNRDLASFTVGERHRTYLRKMLLFADLPMFANLKWRRFQTSRANIHRGKSTCCVSFIPIASLLRSLVLDRPTPRLHQT